MSGISGGSKSHRRLSDHDTRPEPAVYLMSEVPSGGGNMVSIVRHLIFSDASGWSSIIEPLKNERDAAGH